MEFLMFHKYLPLFLKLNCVLAIRVKFFFLVMPVMNVMKTSILYRLVQINAKTVPMRLCAWVEQTFSPRKTIGVAGGM